MYSTERIDGHLHHPLQFPVLKYNWRRSLRLFKLKIKSEVLCAFARERRIPILLRLSYRLIDMVIRRRWIHTDGAWLDFLLVPPQVSSDAGAHASATPDCCVARKIGVGATRNRVGDGRDGWAGMIGVVCGHARTRSSELRAKQCSPKPRCRESIMRK